MFVPFVKLSTSDSIQFSQIIFTYQRLRESTKRSLCRTYNGSSCAYMCARTSVNITVLVMVGHELKILCDSFEVFRFKVLPRDIESKVKLAWLNPPIVSFWVIWQVRHSDNLFCLFEFRRDTNCRWLEQKKFNYRINWSVCHAFLNVTAIS